MTKLINGFLNSSKVSRKATIIIESLEHFLKTERDCEQFVREFANRALWSDPKKTLKMMKLANEIGNYHYPQKTLDELLQMDTKEALQHLFMEPVNCAKLGRFKQSSANITDLFMIKQQLPNVKLMGALLYA
ncbi:hypothetical protein MKZ15_06225 [Paenibacillus sp. FSL R7-0216]|uniref:hypothetical protein n=1 Tax=Paenibacillus sp. FSL R7-0216 TaxID=2921677 RepID=UPI0030DD0385